MTPHHPDAVSSRFTRLLPAGIWVIFFIITVVYTRQIMSGGHEWKTADWLINYSDGMVRRGLIGHLIWLLSGWGIPILWLTYAVQLGIQVTLYGLILRLYNRIPRHWIWLFLLYSPGFLMFSLYQPLGGYRKEIMVLALFAYLCWQYTQHRLTPLKLAVITLLYAMAGLSHELTVFTYPFFVFILYRGVTHRRITAKVGLVTALGLMIVSLVVLGVSFQTRYPPHGASVICQSLIQRGVDVTIKGHGSICGDWAIKKGVLNRDDVTGGAIESLEANPADARAMVISMFFGSSHPLLVIGRPLFLYALTLLPLCFTTFWQRTRVLFLLGGVVSFLPLFILATDWGRWVAILAFMSICIALTDDIALSHRPKRWVIIVGMVYLSTWSIPMFTGIDGGVIEWVAHYQHRIRQGLHREIRQVFPHNTQHRPFHPPRRVASSLLGHSLSPA